MAYVLINKKNCVYRVKMSSDSENLIGLNFDNIFYSKTRKKS